MSVTLWAGLLCEAVSVALLRHRLGKLWLRRPVTVLVLVSVACQGLPAVLLSFPSIAQWDGYRTGIAPGYLDDATLLLSAAMLAFTFCYLLTQPQRAGAQAVTALDWRWPALACLPLAVLTYQGRGYANGTFAAGNGAPAGTVLAAEFFVLLVVLSAYGFALRHGRFLAVLAAQSVLLAATGERSPVLSSGVALTVLLCHAGRRPSGRQLRIAAALTVAAMLAVTGVRAVQGRAVFRAGSGPGARVTALAGGLSGFSAPPGQPPLIAQIAARLDNDAYAGAILQSVHYGQPRLSPALAAESVLLAVPSAVWPSKLAHALDPALLETEDFGLKPVNFLGGMGLYAGILSPWWLTVFLGIIGAACGWGERWLLRRRTPARTVMLAGSLIAVFSFEAGLPTMLVGLRAAAIVAVIVAVLRGAPARSRRIRGAVPPARRSANSGTGTPWCP